MDANEAPAERPSVAQPGAAAAQGLAPRHWPPDDPEKLQCPFPMFAELRQNAPVYRCPVPDEHGIYTYIVTGFPELVEVLTKQTAFTNDLSPVLASHDINLFKAPAPDVPTFYDDSHVFFSTGEDHKVKRSWALKLSDRSRLPGYMKVFEAEVDALIDGFIDRGRCDFKADFSDAMPLSVVRMIMDLPPELDPMVKRLSAGIAALENNPDPSPYDLDNFEDAVDELLGFNVEVLRERFQNPRENDYISTVIRMQVDRDGSLDVNALSRHLAMTIFGADHAMGGHLADLAARLGQDLELQDRLRADRSLIKGFHLETLRFITPVPWIYRNCVVDTEIGGETIKAGSLVLMAFVSGNYDPDEFPDPGLFNIDRPNLERSQLSLGRGAHRCAGAQVARLLAEVTVNRLLDRLENIRLDEKRSELLPPPSYVFRIAQAVHLTFDKRVEGS